jgi:integrase
MGLFKRCDHKARQRDRCDCAWWGSFQYDGRLHRVSLEKWGNEDIQSKEQAKAVYDRFRHAVREGRASEKEDRGAEGSITFNRFADVYIDRYVRANALASADTIEYRMATLRDWFGPKLLREIRTADVEDFVAMLKVPALLTRNRTVLQIRRPATINRYLSLLRHMFNWAEGREYIERTPLRRGNVALVRQEQEDNHRHRRVTPDEEGRLLAQSAPHLKVMIIIALDTGARRGEMLGLTWADIDARPNWIRFRGATTKSGKTRFVPISTVRLQVVLDFLRVDAAGERKASDVRVLSNPTDEPIKYFQTAWHAAVLRAHGVKPKRAGERGDRRTGRLTAGCLEALRRTDLHWHDLRHEYASRLAERNVPLSQIRDLLGHHSIVTTERYDNQTPDALMAAVRSWRLAHLSQWLHIRRRRARKTRALLSAKLTVTR